MSKLQLHVTGLNQLAKCGIAFERRYLLNERTPARPAMAVGTAVDRSVTANLGHRIATTELLTEEEVLDTARDALVAEWERGVEPNEDDAEEGLGTRDLALDASVNLASLHHNKLAPQLLPTHVQRSWTLDVTGLDLQLAGTIDVQEGMLAIRDTKTSAKSPSRSAIDTSLQLTTYALAVHAHDGQIPDKVALDYLVRTPLKQRTSLVQLESTRTKEDFKPLLERIAAADRTIHAGLFTPAPADSWWCSAKWCAYHPTCPYALRPVSA
jgi:PD-(D/E)XK nuclease superfamily protein